MSTWSILHTGFGKAKRFLFDVLVLALTNLVGLIALVDELGLRHAESRYYYQFGVGVNVSSAWFDATLYQNM